MEKAALIHLEPSGIRMITEKLMGGMYHKLTDDMFESVPFIEDIYEHGDISEETKLTAMRVFKLFKTIADNRGIKRVHIIACSLFNTTMKLVKAMFDEMNKLSSPFSVHLMSPEEECKQTYNATVGTVEYPKGIFLKVNMHNTFIVNFAKRNLVYYKILPFGAYTMMKKFATDATQKPKKIVSDIAKYMKSETKALGLDLSMFEEVHYVGAGNFFHVLGRLHRKMTHYPLDVDNNYTITLDQLEKVLETLEEQGFSETKRLSGRLSNESIAVLLSSFAIMKGFAQAQKAKEYTIAIRDIINAYMANRVVRETSNDSISNDHMDISAENIRYFYNVDDSNSEHVHFLTMELFKQMSIVHKLARKDMRPLKIASMFYDFGKRVSMYNHSKYCRESIMYAGVLNATHRDLVVAGFAAQCQNLENFSLADWVKYKDIVDEEDLISARKIGTMIAIAKALDCTKQKKITQLSCDLLGDIVIIKATSTQDISYELAEANKLLPVFKKVFKKSFQIM